MFSWERTPLFLQRYWYWYFKTFHHWRTRLAFFKLIVVAPYDCHWAQTAVCGCLSVLIVRLVQWVSSMRHIQTCLSVQFSGSGIIQHVSGRGPAGLLDPRAASCSALTWGNGASGKHGRYRGQHRPRRYLTTGQTASWLPPGKQHSLCLDCSVQTWILY